MAKHWIVRLGLIFIALTVAMPIFAEEELVFWNFWDTELIAPVIEKFEAENPGVKIRNEQLTWNNGLDKIIVSMANNRAPDICEMGSTWMGKFMSEGALLDVTDKFSDLKDKYLMWEPVQMNGRLYGMPWLVGTRVVFYNKDLLAKAGLDPEKPPVTWQQLLDACKAIHNPKEGVFGFGMNAGEGHILYKKFLPLAWGNGAKVLDENGNFVFDSHGHIHNKLPIAKEIIPVMKADGFTLVRRPSNLSKTKLLQKVYKHKVYSLYKKNFNTYEYFGSCDDFIHLKHYKKFKGKTIEIMTHPFIDKNGKLVNRRDIDFSLLYREKNNDQDY